MVIASLLVHRASQLAGELGYIKHCLRSKPHKITLRINVSADYWTAERAIIASNAFTMNITKTLQDILIKTMLGVKIEYKAISC